MNKLTGLSAAPGVAYGPAYAIRRGVLHAERRSFTSLQIELIRLESALNQAEIDLKNLAGRAREQVGEKEAGIFEAQGAILRDPELKTRVKDIVEHEQVNVDFAWYEAIRFYAGSLRKLEDEYLAARAADVEDVGQRVLALLMGRPAKAIRLESPSIIVAQELTPADTILLDRTTVLAFCTRVGGPTSHVAILSTALGVPCIMGLGAELEAIQDGDYLIVNGNTGELLIRPDAQTRKKYESIAGDELTLKQAAAKTAALPAVTLDGKRVEVVSNISSHADALEAINYGAEGIGLLRTEFLFLARATAPDVLEQVNSYVEIFKVMGQSKPIVVRTLDIGGDKPASYLNLPFEKNPFLGLRGIRLTLRFQDLFRNQLRALLIAGAGYDLRIMFPMVSSLEELNQAQNILGECRLALSAEGKQYCLKVQVGIMVEVPSAAIKADSFADVVDFFSIGTNDLSQYTLAAERTNADVAYLADPFHPAVLELIKRVLDAAHKKGKWVGLCGELAGDPLATPLLLGLGLDEFSASPKLIPILKQTIRQFSMKDCNQVAQKALGLTSAKDVREYLQNAIKEMQVE
jgi:phosphoenolpyruvate-protein phosphotransferase (PTS system enzyme I)